MRRRHWAFRALSAFCAIAFCLGLSGCWSNQELNNLIFVMGVGVDISASNPSDYYVTYQAPEMRALKSGSTDATTYRTVFSNVIGLTDAYLESMKQASRALFLKNNQVIVIGKAQAERGIEQIIDYFLRNYNSRISAKLVISETTAEELLGASSGLEALPAVKLQKMMDSQQNEGASGVCTLYDYARALVSETTMPTIPLMGIESANGNERITFTSTAVFENNRLIAVMGPSETKIIQLLRPQSR
ncbi:MAG: hypothetical protein LBC69_03400, partial [Eubacteriaceae bacterium]|nr:hypothetical protein [Eubacteriaceae bacterium]